MLHSHLKEYTDWSNEDDYRVRLRDNLSKETNKRFQDSDGLDPAWMKNIWQQLFRVKLNETDISVPAGPRILDVCCGQGFLGEYFQEKLGAIVTFADLSSQQLSLLKTRLNAADRSSQVFQADLLDLPFSDESFDLVVGNSFLHHLPDVPGALQEIRRVLKSSGNLIFFHEPSITADWWETFPLSFAKDTTYNSGFTDLWQFRTEDLVRLLNRTGLGNIGVIGSGILGAVLCNWYLIIMNKLRIRSKYVIKPALMLRIQLMRLELRYAHRFRLDRYPSLLITATKE